MATRRTFLEASAAAALSVGAADPTLVHPARNALRILILGGTGFIGPHMVEAALARGHHVTLFNRGRTNSDLFPAVEKLVGDRDGGLDVLRGRRWDAVIDNSGYVPRLVRDSAEVLRDAVGRYLFTSTLSVFAGWRTPDQDETGPLATLEDPTIEEVNGSTYGPLKVLCERAVEDVYGPRALILRPGLIVGPGDSTDRFTYWPVRIDRGGEVLAPGDPTTFVRLIDVRDMAAWFIDMLEQDRGGVYNTVGPGSYLTMAEMLYGIRAVTTADVWFTWVDGDFLSAQGVQTGRDFPLWIPPRDGFQGHGRVSRRRAMEAGLTFRPLADTARDTLAWFKSQPLERQRQLRAGIGADREAELLGAWHAAGG